MVLFNLVARIHHLRTLLELINELENLFGGVLEIIVHDDGAISCAVIQASHDRVVLAKVGGQVNEHNVMKLLGE